MSDIDTLMPPAQVQPMDDEETLRRKLITNAGGMSAMPAASRGPSSGDSGGQGMPPAGAAKAEPEPVGAPTMPAANVGPQQKRYNDLSAQGAPELHGWKKVLNAIGSVSPLGRSIESAIPGSPENYNEALNSAAVRAAKEQGITGTQQKQGAEVADEARKAADEPLNQRYKTALARHTEDEADALENAPEDEHKDIVKEFSNALASGDQEKIDELAPRVKQYIETTAKPTKDPAEKSTKEQLQAQISAADAKGDTATVKTLQSRLKAIDPEGQQRMNITVEGQNKAADRAEASASRKDIAAHDKEYVKPAEDVEKSYQMMDHAYKEYQNAKAQGKELPTGAQSMLALSTHLATTFGNVKGARVTKDMIEHHLGARGISDSALVAVQRLTNGDVLSPDQWQAFHDLIGQSRKLSWDTATKEAKRKNIPVDFLPDDLDPEKQKEAGSTGKGGIKIHRDANGRIVGVE